MNATNEVTGHGLRIKRIQAAVRMMFKYLTTDLEDERDIYALALAGDLNEAERERLASLLISTFPPDMAEYIVKEWFKGAGFPSVQIMENPVQDAKFWVEHANSKELGAYAMACFNRMTRARRHSFIKWCEAQDAQT